MNRFGSVFPTNSQGTRPRRQRRGVVIVEFAVVALILVSLIIAVVEFGRAVWVRNTVGHAAREGARWAIVRGNESGRPTDDAAVSAYVQSKIPITGLTVTTTWTPNKDPGSVVQVRVQSAFTAVIPMIPAVTLTGTSRMVIAF